MSRSSNTRSEKKKKQDNLDAMKSKISNLSTIGLDADQIITTYVHRRQELKASKKDIILELSKIFETMDRLQQVFLEDDDKVKKWLFTRRRQLLKLRPADLIYIGDIDVVHRFVIDSTNPGTELFRG